MVKSVIECICDDGMMASIEFPCEDVFTKLDQALQQLAKEVQEGRQPKAASKAFADDFCLKRIRGGQLEYVTGDGMVNFAGKKLGDWKKMCADFEEAAEKKLSEGELKETQARMAE